MGYESNVAIASGTGSSRRHCLKLHGHEWYARSVYVRELALLSFPPSSIRINRYFAPSKWFLQQLSSSHLHMMLAGFEDKSVQITNTFAYSMGPGHEPVLFQGQLNVSHL
jgi:hypothetical protein